MVKRFFIYFLLPLLSLARLSGQILNQDASGNSSILASGGSIGIDIKQALFKVNYYSPTDRKQGVFFGFDLQGKNSTGFSELFSKEKFTPQSTLSSAIGYHWAKTNYKKNVTTLNKLDHEIKRNKDSTSSLINKLDTITVKYIKATAQKIRGLGNIDIASKIEEIAQKPEYLKYQKLFNELQYSIPTKKADQQGELSELLIDLSNRINSDSILNRYIKTTEILNELREKKKRIENDPTNSFSKNKIYLRGGLNTTEFKLDLQNLDPNFEKRYQDTSENFALIELGITRRFKQNLFGLSFTYKGISSFDNLKKSTYTLSTVDTTIKNGRLTKSTEVIAFNGNYFKSGQSIIRFDWLRIINWKEQKSKYLAIGIYLDRNFFGKGNNIEFLEDRTTLGLSLSLFDGKDGQYNAGFYMQKSDLFNETNSGSSKSLTFGLTTKYIINNPIRPERIERE